MPKTLTFTVDAKLLKELGERLVGKPSTALAELVKNSYDADATLVELVLDRTGEGQIEVRDNGHGMTFEEFRDYWMRLGSQHKRQKGESRHFGRPLTGSKGVGRVAAQLLSRRLTLITVSERDPSVRLIASLDWEKAVESGDLIDVQVEIREEDLQEPADSGTSLILKDLRQEWSEDEVENLAQEIWQLQPPFGEAVPREKATAKDFKVQFGGPEEDLVEVFDKQMQAILRLWVAKAKGVNKDGEAKIALQFKGDEVDTYKYTIDDCKLSNGHFEIRFYKPEGRQPHGLRVDEVREYLREFGGVHIYDTGFRLPYYGERENDWLRLIHDNARRLSLSHLLPEEMQVKRGMLSLPNWYRVLGAVEINTSEEPNLEITITRDRLQESEAFDQLRDFVRRAIHWYANEQKRRQLVKEVRKGEDGNGEPSSTVGELKDVIGDHHEEIPEDVQDKISEVIDETKERVKEQEKSAQRRIGALSSFATAGISAVGYQHELNKQLLAIESLSEQIGEALEDGPASTEKLSDLRDELLEWVDRARETGKIFSHLTEPENLEDQRRYVAKDLISSVIDQVEPIERGVTVSLERLDPELRLPRGSYMEWVSVFQNAFFNALNAMIDSEDKTIRVRNRVQDSNQQLLIEDTGVGVDLSDSSQLFEPFEREIGISQTRRELGFGGSGLGLTIIRMITRQKGVEVFFQEPEDGFSTALTLEWSE